MAIHDNLLDQLRRKIQADMHNKFGLSLEEADASSSLFFSHIKNITSRQFYRENKDQLLALLPDFSNLRKSNLFENLSGNFKNDLINKIGLNEETADRIKEFSVEELVLTIKQELKDVEEKFDVATILKKIGLEKYETEAKDMVSSISKLFSK